MRRKRTTPNRPKHSAIIRAAEPRDFDQLLALFDRVAAEGKWIATEPGFDRERYRNTWQAIVEGKGGALFVACDGRNVVASLRIWVTQSGDHELGMLVAQERRGQGIGESLVAEAINWARQHNIPELRLGVFPHNEAAIRLYEKMGFVHIGLRERRMVRQSGETWDVMLMRIQLDETTNDRSNLTETL